MPDLNPATALGSPAPTGHALAAEATLDVTGADLDRLLLRRDAAELTPPQALAARMDGDAADWERQADRHRDRQKFAPASQCAARASGVREWSGVLRRQLAPQWDALQRELTEVAAHAVIAERDRNEARQERDVYRASAVMHCRERDEARAEADRLRPLEAEAQRAHGEATRLRAELAACREHNAAIAVQSDQYRNGRDELRALIDAHQPTLASRLLAAREKLDEIRAMVDATPAHFSAEQLAIVLAGVHDAAGLEPS